MDAKRLLSLTAVIVVIIAIMAISFHLELGLGTAILAGLGTAVGGIAGLLPRRSDTDSTEHHRRSELSDQYQRHTEEFTEDDRESRERIGRVREELRKAEAVVGETIRDMDSITRLLGKDIAEAKARRNQESHN